MILLDFIFFRKIIQEQNIYFPASLNCLILFAIDKHLKALCFSLQVSRLCRRFELVRSSFVSSHPLQPL